MEHKKQSRQLGKVDSKKQKEGKIMKKTEKFIVLRGKNTGGYLQNYKNNDDSIACTSNWTEKIKEAAFMPVDFFYHDEERNNKLANFFDAEPILVEAEFSLKTLDGKEPKDFTKEIEEAKRKHFENFLRDLLAEDDKEE